MKTILTTLLLAMVLTTNAQQFKKDKQMHFVAGTVIGFGTHLIAKKYELSKGEELALTLILGLGVGCAKEFYDHFSGRGNTEFWDAGYTALGAVTLDVTLLTINLKHKKQK